MFMQPITLHSVVVVVVLLLLLLLLLCVCACARVRACVRVCLGGVANIA